MRGDRGGAVSSLNRAIACDPECVYALVRKAEILSSAGRHEEAVGTLRMAEAVADDEPRIKEERARMVILAGMSGDILADSERILKGGDPEAVASLARCLADRGEPFRALDMLDGVLVEDPGNIRSLGLKADILSEVGRLEEAESIRRAMRNLHEGDARIAIAPEEDEEEDVPRIPAADTDQMRRMALSLEAAGDRKGALRAIDSVLEKDPEDPDAICIKARMQMDSGEVKQAMDAADAAVHTHPDHPGLHELLGDCYVRIGDHKAAVMEYSTVLGFTEPTVELYLKRAGAYRESGDVQSEKEDLEKALDLNPDDSEIAVKIAHIEADRGQFVAAALMMKRALATDRDLESILFYASLGASMEDEEYLSEALGMFKALHNPPTESIVHMSIILESAGMDDEALALMGRSSKSDVTSATIKRYAEKALRRAYATGTNPAGPDVLSYLGLDEETSSKVRDYLLFRPDYGRIIPNTDEFRRMERASHDLILKLEWYNLESKSDIPFEVAFVKGGFKDADDAKRVVAYISKAMQCDIGRSDDPRLSTLSMGLPKGMAVYDVMAACDLGVYEAREVLGLVVRSVVPHLGFHELPEEACGVVALGQ
jgi:tetratricopeptide (TPR) repeat protein